MIEVSSRGLRIKETRNSAAKCIIPVEIASAIGKWEGVQRRGLSLFIQGVDILEEGPRFFFLFTYICVQNTYTKIPYISIDKLI